MAKKHYTAVIQIKRVDEPTPKTSSSRYSEQASSSDGNRVVSDVSSFTIRGDSIESLIKQATQHLNLVEDIGGNE